MAWYSLFPADLIYVENWIARLFVCIPCCAVGTDAFRDMRANCLLIAARPRPHHYRSLGYPYHLRLGPLRLADVDV